METFWLKMESTNFGFGLVLENKSSRFSFSGEQNRGIHLSILMGFIRLCSIGI
ncbi:Protein CBG27025 [Caenorhabditis briggsae]|uniref:Protein CBG27025 n=1 Tax=Caenorhabditis briggsae TaxID=6238 RepID=B6IM91_CAEBR|nr:Protein CBG27025 [Caenorhabditis briggsae]CAS01021.1 Protein CBG27025 [Caenorhabditis briggsae]